MRRTSAWRAESRVSTRGNYNSCPRSEPDPSLFGSPVLQDGEWERLFQMEFQDKVLKCVDCGTEFVFTAGEQLFFHDKQFKNEPKRCKSCKGKRVAVLGAGSQPHSYQKTETRTNCSQCGKETTVPFRPTQGRPVLCRECFQQARHVASA